ncbi:Rpl30 [Symbiodinium natans]|uniref:Rpl30 protein n=1 Tax=Symbiodinium natans TaxID=878477 RepID=A0A812U7D0_9DINO|nr:Rpl30 [Symbiodinium natans]
MERDARIEPVDQRCTTIILRGLNRQVTREMMTALLNDTAPRSWERSRYDYIYVPWTTDGTSNIGLAFANFESPAACQEYMVTVNQRRSLAKLSEYHVRSVGMAAIQGRGANLSAVITKRGSEALTGFDAPLVFMNGQRSSLRSVVEREVAGHLAAIALQNFPLERVGWVQPALPLPRGLGAGAPTGPGRTGSEFRGVAGVPQRCVEPAAAFQRTPYAASQMLALPPPTNSSLEGKGAPGAMQDQTVAGYGAALATRPDQMPFHPRVRVETTSTAGAQAVTRLIFDL